MIDKTEHTSFKPAKDSNRNDEDPDRRYEALVAVSANIALTMLHRGKFLEDELQRALSHVRTSNEFLTKFVELLESADEDRDGEERVGSWKEVAERVKSIVEGDGRRDEEKEGGQDGDEKEMSVVKGESDGKP